MGHSVLATSGGFLGRNAGCRYLVACVIADDEGGKSAGTLGGRTALQSIGRPEAVGRGQPTAPCERWDRPSWRPASIPSSSTRTRRRRSWASWPRASWATGSAASYLGERLGTAVAGKHITIVDDPRIPREPGSRLRRRGPRTKKNTVVSRGASRLPRHLQRPQAQHEAHGVRGRQRRGAPRPTTSSVRPGRRPSRLQGIERGLYVTDMMGFGFDAMGNFSRGAGGFLIEHGELTRPVGEITISRNLDGSSRASSAWPAIWCCVRPSRPRASAWTR